MSVDQEGVVAELREQIAAVDRDLIALVNTRLELVSRLWAHKRAHDLPLRAPDREQWLHDHLQSSNAGPLSEDGVRRLHQSILELTRSELG